MRKSFLLAAIVAPALALGACSSVRINENHDSQNYYDGAFEFATQSGSIKTVVIGSPFGKDDRSIADKTTALMKGATPGSVVTFEPSDWTKADNSFRVVVLFNGRMPYDQDAISKKGPEIGTDPGRSTVRMDAALCHGDYLISSADGSVDGLKGPDDPRFRELVRGVALAMIPAYNYNRDSSDTGGIPP